MLAEIGAMQHIPVSDSAVVLIGDEVFRSAFAFAIFQLVILFLRLFGGRFDGSTVLLRLWRFRCRRLSVGKRGFRRPGGDIVGVVLHPLQFAHDSGMVFPCQVQFLLLGKLLAESRLDGFHFGDLLPDILTLPGDGLIQTLAEKVVHALKQTGQTELVVKAVPQIVGLELPIARALEKDAEAVLRGKRGPDF